MTRVFLFLFAAFFSISISPAQTTITGRITGVNGETMNMAHVVLAELPDHSPLKTAVADNEGRFSMAVDTVGIWMLKFYGVLHSSYSVALYISKPENVTVDVRLGSYKYLEDFNSVKVTGNFNNWYPLSAIPMKKQSNGTYYAEIATTLDSLVYQLKYVRDGADIEGTQADEYRYNKSGSYYSIVAPKNDTARIAFDPKKLFISGGQATITFGGADSVITKFARIFDEFQHYQDAYQSAFSVFLKARGKISQFKFDWSDIISSFERQLKEETDTILLKELYVVYLSTAISNKLTDKTIYQTALEKITPYSPLWLLNTHSIYYALNHSGYSDKQQDDYVQQVLSGNPAARVKTALIFDEFYAAKYTDQRGKAAEYYHMLTSAFAETPEAIQIKKSHPHEIDLMVGKPVPKFSAVSMDDSTETFTNESFRGKYLLLYFWAASQKTSAREVKILQNVYQKYKNMNFEILSFSVDSTSSPVAKFRKTKLKMPWKHAFLGVDIDNKIVRDFQVNMFPNSFFIDPNGNLLAMGTKLEEIKLGKMLKKYLRK